MENIKSPLEQPKKALRLLPNTPEEVERKREEKIKVQLELTIEEAGIPNRFLSLSLETSPWLKRNQGARAFFCEKREPREGEYERVVKADGVYYRDLRSPEEKALDEQEDKNREASCFLWGPTGTGKTAIATGSLLRYIDFWGTSGYFLSVPALFTKLRRTFNGSGNESELMERYSTACSLVLDDLGVEHISGSGWLEDRLYQIVANRHAEELKTIFTSNLSLVELGKRLGDRIVWRIVEMCGDHVYHVDGPNLRDHK